MSDSRLEPSDLTESLLREVMSLGDTPVTGNGFVRACELLLGARGWGKFVPCSLNQMHDSEQRVCDVLNKRGLRRLVKEVRQ